MTSSVDIFFFLSVTAKIYFSEDIVEQPFLSQARNVLHTWLWWKISKHQPRIEPVEATFGRKREGAESHSGFFFVLAFHFCGLLYLSDDALSCVIFFIPKLIYCT